MENSTLNKSCIQFNFGADGVLILESCLLVLLSLISFCVNALLAHMLRRSTGQTGIDVRALLLNTLISCMIRSIYFLLRGIYVLFLLKFGFDHMAIDGLVCSFLEFPYGVSTAATILCMLAIGINRFLMTRPIDRGSTGSFQLETRRNSRENEGISAKTRLSIALVWIIAVIFYVSLMFGMEQESICFCYYPMIVRPNYSYASTTFFLTCEVAVLIIYIIVLVRNRSMLMQFTLRTRQYNLRQRCRAWMNVRTTKMLLPPAIVHAFMVIVVVCAVSPIRNALEDSADVHKFRLVLLIQLGICLDVIAFPLLCIRFNEFFWKEAKNIFKFNEHMTRFRGKETEMVDGLEDGVVEGHRSRSGTNQGSEATSNLLGKQKTIVDYRLAPEVHEQIVQRTWEMKPRKAK